MADTGLWLVLERVAQATRFFAFRFGDIASPMIVYGDWTQAVDATAMGYARHVVPVR